MLSSYPNPEEKQMEEARRRLSVITSHFLTTNSSSGISISGCDSRSGDEKKKKSDKGNQDSGCVFCNIASGKAPAFKVYEDDICICILDSNPLSHGHSLIIPKGHFSCLEATPPSVVGAMFSKVPYISNAVMKATGCDSFNLLVNNGAAAGQVIYHTHIHIIPRNARDCLWASEGFRRRPLKLDNEASNLVHSIREKLSFTKNFEDTKHEESSSLIGNMREH